MKYRLIKMLAVCVLAGSLYLGADALQDGEADRTAKEPAFQEREAEALQGEAAAALPQEGCSREEPVLMCGGIWRELKGKESAVTTSVSMDQAAVGGVMEVKLSREESAGGPLADETDKGAENVPDGSAAQNEADEAQGGEYEDLALANVEHYVNVRKEATTQSAILGKIYGGAVAQILETLEGEDGQWFRIISGNVEGYIKSEYFVYGPAAAEVIDDYVTRYATVLATRLNIRKEPDVESGRIGYADRGEKLRVLENCGDWLKVQYTGTKTGYVAAEYAAVSEEFVYAKTLEEEAAEIAARRAEEERRRAAEAAAAENGNAEEDTTVTAALPVGDYSDNAELRDQIVAYAMQFLGNRYVHGGQSLTTGTDCSGFTSLIYAQFGYSLSRTPAGQLSGAGRSVSYSEIQPGDIICYGSKKCSHVGLYIGDGQIIHAANSRKGVIVSQADYDTILGVRNVID